jgi:hypothetical protein
MLKILANENVTPAMVTVFRELGHDVFDVKEHGIFQTDDLEDIYRLACEMERIIFTLDTDFKNFVKYDPTLCGGIIVAHMKSTRDEIVIPKLKHVLLSTREKDFYKRLAVFTPWSDTCKFFPKRR